MLKSEKKPTKYYLGSTGNLERRINQHNSRKVTSTAWCTPWKLVYYEAFLTEEDAREREHKLKHHGKGMNELKKRLEYSILMVE